MKMSFYAIYYSNGKTNSPCNLFDSLSSQVVGKKGSALEVEDYFVIAQHIVDKSFLITKTYDSAFVKRVNKRTFSIDEMKNALGSDETLAFSSFLLIKDNIIGYASSQHGPRARDLQIYLANKLNVPIGYKLCIEPLMRDVSKDDALEMQFIGRTTLKVESGSKLLSPLLRATGIETIDEELLEGVEIILKPKRSRNIRDMAKELIKNADDSHSDILIKGKEQAADLLTEYYLSSKGHLAANLYKSTNEDIAEEMETCFIRMKPVIIKSFKDAFDGEL